jgi:hypothetical protein
VKITIAAGRAKASASGTPPLRRLSAPSRTVPCDLPLYNVDANLRALADLWQRLDKNSRTLRDSPAMLDRGTVIGHCKGEL